LETDRLHGDIFEAVPDPLVVMDGSGRVHAANPAALRVLDVGLPGAAGRHDPRVEVDVAALRELVAPGKPLQGADVIDRFGRVTHFHVDVIPMGSNGPALLHFRLRVDALTRELWTDDAVATVAHEFRSPLSAMKSALTILLAGDAGMLAPAQQRFLDAVTRGVGRLSRIVDGYLDLGRVRAGALVLERRDEDVRSLLETLAGDLALCHPALFARLRVEVADDGCVVFADRDRVTQVILNLVYNAARFTPGEGRVTLRARRAGREALDDARRLLPFGILGEPSFTCIDVADEGLGMSADALAHVFDRYHDGGGEPHPGAGAHLGLHIARVLVDAHEGRLHIESSLGVGTTASVYLPADAATAQLLSRLHEAEAAVRVARAARRRVTLRLIEADAVDTTQRDTWILRDGLALTLSGGRLIEDNTTFAGALRAAARDLQEAKNNRAARAVPGLEPVRE
jgi:signal transduction histidine kinase